MRDRWLGAVLIAGLATTAAGTGTTFAQDGTVSSPLARWEDVLPMRQGVVLWARNPTGDTVWVDSLHVIECVNIRKGCGSSGIALAIPPGATRRLARLEPAVPDDPFSYRWSLDWRSEQGERRKRTAPTTSPTRRI